MLHATLFGSACPSYYAPGLVLRSVAQEVLRSLRLRLSVRLEVAERGGSVLVIAIHDLDAQSGHRVRLDLSAPLVHDELRLEAALFEVVLDREEMHVVLGQHHELAVVSANFPLINHGLVTNQISLYRRMRNLSACLACAHTQPAIQE